MRTDKIARCVHGDILSPGYTMRNNFAVRHPAALAFPGGRLRRFLAQVTTEAANAKRFPLLSERARTAVSAAALPSLPLLLLGRTLALCLARSLPFSRPFLFTLPLPPQPRHPVRLSKGITSRSQEVNSIAQPKMQLRFQPCFQPRSCQKVMSEIEKSEVAICHAPGINWENCGSNT